ncbi:DUF2637 domain-containing protein [Nocardia miyunensis]|uniref:DUF2637 domain-containing protein n=1 Tax=Nocardia miyunensis TaxID=282684 RepID=UPI000833A7A2|nr:DUF2637 domain-containing protein [Nocardia miyunensis]
MFFWAVLAVSALVSVAGNALHAVLHAHAVPVLAAGVAVVPPIALLTAVHGVTVLLRAGSQSRSVHRIAITMTVFIAAAAFWLSFTALRALAQLAGIPYQQTWLWPLIIEGSATQATVALIALTRAQQAPAYEPPAADSAFGDDSSPRPLPSDGNTAEPMYSHSRDRRWARIAMALCSRDPVHRRSPEDIVQILTWHHEDGLTPTEIARMSPRSRSTISRIIEQAAELDLPAPAPLSASTSRDNATPQNTTEPSD